MHKIARVHFNDIGYRDAVFEAIPFTALDRSGAPAHHVLHAANGTGKTTALALIFSLFEPDRRKFLRTEMIRAHKIEHYFRPDKLGSVALEIVRPGPGGASVRHVLGGVFWLTPGTKGDDGEPGIRRFFGFEAGGDLTYESLPFKGLGPGPHLKTLEGYMKWARDQRAAHPDRFFATDSHAAWRKYLDDIGIDRRMTDVQRRFCATEGGISDKMLSFKTESEFLESIFSFMMPPATSERIIKAVDAGLTKIQSLPRLKEQLRALEQLEAAFTPFFAVAGELEAAEAEQASDLRALATLHARLIHDLGLARAKSGLAAGELKVQEQRLANTTSLVNRLEGEILFLDKTGADARVREARAAVARAEEARTRAGIRRRAAEATSLRRRLAAARGQRDALEAELKRLEEDLAPDRARLGRAGAALHAQLDRMAAEADANAARLEEDVTALRAEARRQTNTADTLREQVAKLNLEIAQFERLLSDHRQERGRLERAGAMSTGEAAEAARARLSAEITGQDDALAAIDLQDEALEGEASELVRRKAEADADIKRLNGEITALDQQIAKGRALERTIGESPAFQLLLAGSDKDPYRPDLRERLGAAIAGREESHRRLLGERDAIKAELSFLEESGVAAVPEDVARVAEFLKDAGFHQAQPAEHYLAQFKPEAEAAMALVRQDPARFTGVFVGAGDDLTTIAAAADKARLKLKGPVLVSPATLAVAPSRAHDSTVVLGPFSAARFNTRAAAEEKARLAAALESKDVEVERSRLDLADHRTVLATSTRLQDEFCARPPAILEQDRARARDDRAQAQKIQAEAGERLAAIADSRALLKRNRAEIDVTLTRLRGWRQDVERFCDRFANMGVVADELAHATGDRNNKTKGAEAARSACDTARTEAEQKAAHAAELRNAAKSRRGEKRFFPETDGQPAVPVGTLEDLITAYRDADQILASKRETQQAEVAQRLRSAKDLVITLEAQEAEACDGLREEDLAAFDAVADIARAIETALQDEARAGAALDAAKAEESSANGYQGPIAQTIDEAAGRGVVPVSVPGFEDASFAVCQAERASRRVERERKAREAGQLKGEVETLGRQVRELNERAARLEGLAEKAAVFLPDEREAALPDLSLDAEAFKPTLDALLKRLNGTKQRIGQHERDAEEAYQKVRAVFTADAFKRLEPQWSDQLVAYTPRQAGAGRKDLDLRLKERIGIVREQIDTHRRDEQLCLDHLRQHLVYADDLLKRAVAASHVPEGIPEYGGKAMLRVKKVLREVAPDVIQHQLAVYLSELANLDRRPKDGAKLAAELLHRVHGGSGGSTSVLGIVLLKPKRDAIEPYMPVDRIGVSGGEGVTVAIMLYAVIQKMAMDERVEGPKTQSGGFLILDNTFGKSNHIEHVQLQLTMAARLGIQLFMSASAEDKHVIDLFPTITRMAQGERVLWRGVPQYIRVKVADYQLEPSSHAA